MSRIPRVLEHLKTGFTAEAVSAAQFRAYAHRARQDGRPKLAEQWLRLAEGKDELARLQLEAAGKVRGGATDVTTEMSDERYENEVLYPKLIRDAVADPDAAALFQRVVEAQKEHLRHLDALRRALGASHGDVEMPDEVVHAGEPVSSIT